MSNGKLRLSLRNRIMLRKILYGTLALALISVLIVGGCIGLTLYEIQNLVVQVKELQEEYQDTNEKFGLPPLSDEEDVPSTTIESFLDVRRRTGGELRRTLEQIDSDLATRNRELAEGSEEQVGFLSLMDLLKTQFSRLAEVARMHVELLREHEMSAALYTELTHLLLSAVAQASEAEEGDTLYYLSGEWNRYDRPLRYFQRMLSQTQNPELRLARPVGDFDEFRTTLAEDATTTKTTRLAAMLRDLSYSAAPRTSPPTPSAPEIKAEETVHVSEIEGTHLLDIIIRQFDPSVLADE